MYPHQIVAVRLHEEFQRVGILSQQLSVFAVESHLYGVLHTLIVELFDSYHSIGISIDVGVFVSLDYPLGDIVVFGADNHLGIVLGGHIRRIGRHKTGRAAAHKGCDTNDVFVLTEYLLEILTHLSRLLQGSTSGQVYLDGKTVALGFGHKLQRKMEEKQYGQSYREESSPDSRPRVAETEMQEFFVTRLQTVEETVLYSCQHILAPPFGLNHPLFQPRG